MSIRWTYAFVDRPAELLGRAQEFWTVVTDTRLSAPRGPRDEFVTLVPAVADPCVKMQGVEAGNGGAHLDLCVDDVPGFVKGALDTGATMAAEHEDWAVLRSPAGQLFCAVPWLGESVRPPVVHGSRLDQVCLDLAPSVYDTEVAFWSALLADWDAQPSALPEFHRIVPPPGFPVRVLLQRLDEERAASAHLDLACSDIETTRIRHEKLGAETVSRGTQWTVLRDPAGGTYCLTGRDPETGSVPASNAF
ncbi:VOC family protein [Streptomyces sp. NPDC020489]|uniref:VOC family protein n=1 Tax=Streptomyces sp. NPDC020489 TaxID=3365077 RepID=UPI0037B4BEB5